MAGYVIHLAVAEEYKKNYPMDIDNYSDFIDGVIYPDSVLDKSLTHYGEKSSKVELKKFFDERDIQDSYNKGYFLHLVTDYLFYNKFLEYFSKDIYDDYDKLNKELIRKFEVKLPNNITDKVNYIEGETKILDLNNTIDFIKKTSKYRLKDVKELVLKNDENWTKFRKLNKI